MCVINSIMRYGVICPRITIFFCTLFSELTSGPSETGVAGGGGARQGGSSLGAGQQDSIISSKWAHDDDIKRMIM